MGDMIDSLDSMHFDILKELGNIGAGNAATALSKLIDNKVAMKIPQVKLLSFQETAEILDSPEELVFGILVSLSGDINGIMMFLVKEDSAKALIRCLLGPSGTSDDEVFSEMDLSALQEIGNILSSSYLSALATVAGKSVRPSVPSLAKDMAGAILSVPAIEFGKIADKVLFIESVFGADEENVSGYFILVPDLPSFSIILSALGVG